MTDTIVGFVDGVLSRNTFDLNVKQYDPKNEAKYKSTERIRMFNLPEKVNKMPEEDAKLALKTGLVGKEVVCEVQSADSDGTLVCEVFYKK
jgi:hypothetical protein